jgi:hypothetical protein
MTTTGMGSFTTVRAAIWLAAGAICLGGVISATAQTVTIGPSKDNTLYESVDGFSSNGSGQYFFSGTIATNDLRRGLIAFDVAAAVPAGATITSASLRLNMSRTIASAAPASLHRLRADWGEGASDALGEEGAGTVAAAGDATWLHRFWDTQFWSTPGGDFDATASATTSVGAAGPYVWSGPGLTADVQSWLDNPATNYGWILITDESRFPTAKRFDTRENPIAGNRPQLTIQYSTGTASCGPGEVRGDANCDGVINFDDIGCFVSAVVGLEAWEACVGKAGCSYLCAADVNDDGQVNFDDIAGFVGCIIAGSCD